MVAIGAQVARHFLLLVFLLLARAMWKDLMYTVETGALQKWVQSSRKRAKPTPVAAPKPKSPAPKLLKAAPNKIEDQEWSSSHHQDGTRIITEI